MPTTEHVESADGSAGILDQLEWSRTGHGPTGRRWPKTVLGSGAGYAMQRLDHASYAIRTIALLVNSNTVAESFETKAVLGNNVMGGLTCALIVLSEAAMDDIQAIADQLEEVLS